MYNLDIFKFIYLSYIFNRNIYNKRRQYKLLYRERNDRVFFSRGRRAVKKKGKEKEKMAEGRDGGDEDGGCLHSDHRGPRFAVLASSPARLSKEYTHCPLGTFEAGIMPLR